MKPTHLYLHDALRSQISEQPKLPARNPYAKGTDAFCTMRGPSESDMIADRVRAEHKAPNVTEPQPDTSDWITHNGKGFPAALKGVPPERVMLRTRGCGEGFVCRYWHLSQDIYWMNRQLNPDIEITHYRILPEVTQRQWSAWIPHEPGPCPIPGVKAGEWEELQLDGKAYEPIAAPTQYFCWGHGTTYRILLPEGFTPHDGPVRPKEVTDRFELMLDDGSVVSMYTAAWWVLSNAPKGLRRIIGWRKV